jgi:methyl-accepting chemotaxis protein
MKIRDKLLYGAGVLALLPVVLTALVVGTSGYSSARDSLTGEVQSKLVTLRENKRAQIDDHLNGMVRTVQALARSTTVMEAYKGFHSTIDKIASESGGGDGGVNRFRSALDNYYAKDFTAEFARQNAGNKPDMSRIVRDMDNTTAAMQYHYIVNNPNPPGKKDALATRIDGVSYSNVHAAFHPSLQAVQQKLGYYDIFLIDTDSSRVIYSVFKEIDFGTRLNDGVARDTGLAKVVAAVSKANSADDVALSDYTMYLPSYFDQAAFIATPIFDSGRQIGVLAVQLPIDQVTAVMTSGGKWSNIGLGASGEAYLVGPDKALRTEARFFLEDRDRFMATATGILNPEKLAMAAKKQTSIGIVQVDTEGVRAALGGKAGVGQYKDYRGADVVGAYAPFKVLGLDWAIIAEQDVDEVYAPIVRLRSSLLLRTLLAACAILGATVLLALVFIRTFIRPINTLQHTLGQLATGDFTARSRIATGDEMETLGNALDQLVQDRLEALARTEAENDLLNQSVIELLQTVSQISQRDLTILAPVHDNIIGTVSDSLNLLTRETAAVLKRVQAVARQVDTVTNSVKRQADTVSETAQSERKSVALMAGDLGLATEAMTRISRLAETSNAVASQAIELTRIAQRSVAGTVNGMDLIREQISAVEKRIKRLGERSQEIGQIVSLISTMSERTHALALNASMQAAMAGDAGRGFAVVAEEVQRLSESARTATIQIAQLVQNIQVETNDTIHTMNKAIEQVVAGSQAAAESGERMHDTQETTARLVDLVQQINAGAVAQESITDILRKRVADIGVSTEQTAKQVEVQNRSADLLVSSARHLVAAVSVFKLPA